MKKEAKQLNLQLTSKPKLERAKTTEEAIETYQKLQKLQADVMKKKLNEIRLEHCSVLIQNQVIHHTEAIEWLVQNGHDEDEAFDWAMDRFSPSRWMRTGSVQIRNEISLPKSRSHKRKAA